MTPAQIAEAQKRASEWKPTTKTGGGATTSLTDLNWKVKP
jgi:hypothetical protein